MLKSIGALGSPCANPSPMCDSSVKSALVVTYLTSRNRSENSSDRFGSSLKTSFIVSDSLSLLTRSKASEASPK